MKFHRSSVCAAVVAATAVSLLVGACGSSSPNPPRASDSGGQPTPAQMQQDGDRFVECLRSHGVTNVPDPTPTAGRAFKNAIGSDAPSPAFQSAYTACQHLLPGGGRANQSATQTQAHTVAFLAFARCLRSHGFPNFPDPNSSGQLTHEMVAGAGINLHQPAVLQAGDACVGVTHGAITKLMVARFVAGQ
jgi:hypothetical protein